MIPANGQFNPTAEQRMENDTRAMANQSIQGLDKGVSKMKRDGQPISGDALARMRYEQKSKKKGK